MTQEALRQPSFAQLLRRFLDQRKLGVTAAATSWHVDPRTLHKILGGEVAVPRTKVGWWAQVLEMPEEEVLAAVNRTRAHLGRLPLTPPPLIHVGVPCHTREQAEAAVAGLQASNAPATAGQDWAAVSTGEVTRA